MDSERFDKAFRIHMELNHLRGTLRDAEKVGGVFSIPERYYNSDLREMLTGIVGECDRKAIAWLKEKIAKLEKEFAEL